MSYWLRLSAAHAIPTDKAAPSWRRGRRKATLCGQKTDNVTGRDRLHWTQLLTIPFLAAAIGATALIKLGALSVWVTVLSRARGNLYMAHRCGFTKKVLTGTLQASGFVAVVARRCEHPYYDSWALGHFPG